MIRTLLWLFGGVLLGGLIHLIVILMLPMLASKDVWTKVTALEARNKVVVLPAVLPGTPNPLHLDPGLAYAICQVDLSQGPGVLTGTLPDGFWSLAVFTRAGIIAYSTTNRDGIGRIRDLGIFNAAQTRLLAEQQIDISEGLLIVEAPADDIFILVRFAPPHPTMRPRFETALSQLACGNIQGAT